ncbi:hypothetical protein DE146DRAFT_32747 [Phaeosphaeria sp. MPI-PUGE-AT-0046c]|nr:hypothetical protein DE146DRAFT_32747 [Phaeosphaeria sp. MPI-PUGE-AT-0046c]
MSPRDTERVEGPPCSLYVTFDCSIPRAQSKKPVGTAPPSALTPCSMHQESCATHRYPCVMSLQNGRQRGGSSKRKFSWAFHVLLRKQSSAWVPRHKWFSSKEAPAWENNTSVRAPISDVVAQAWRGAATLSYSHTLISTPRDLAFEYDRTSNRTVHSHVPCFGFPAPTLTRGLQPTKDTLYNLHCDIALPPTASSQFTQLRLLDPTSATTSSNGFPGSARAEQ